MNNDETFERLCRYIWHESPGLFIAVRINPAEGCNGWHTYRFATPDGLMDGTLSITETGLLNLSRRLGYAGIKIVRQRSLDGRYEIPDPSEIEEDKMADY